jgi:hypothetical protein
MNTSHLLLNCFPIKLLPTNFNLPYLIYDSWKISTQMLKSKYGDYQWYRIEEKHDNGRVFALLLNGPERPQELKRMSVDAAVQPDFGKHLISRSLYSYFKARDLTMSRDNFETTALRKAPAFSQNLIDVFCGISFQIRHPFNESPGDFVISAQWVVKTTFNQSIAEPKLRTISQGMPVLYQPTLRAKVDEDMKKFINRYLGHILEILSQTEALVDCKDHKVRHLPLTDLFLETSPAVIREYEKRSGFRQSSRSLWYKVQELNFAMNSQGRRNVSVLKERLQAIRAFLGGSSKEQLIVPVACFQEGTISLALNPVRVEVS